MIGSILEWNGISGRILNIDEGDQVYPFVAADVVGSIEEKDVVTFDNDGMDQNSKAVLVTKK